MALAAKTGNRWSDKSRGQKAIINFNKMIPLFEAFAKAVTGRKIPIKVPVQGDEINSQQAYTDGNTIYIIPPLSLGDTYVHDRKWCGSNDSRGISYCPACANFEGIFSSVCHEIAHLTGGSFHGDIRDTRLSESVKKVSPKFGQMVLNMLEDIRIEHKMFQSQVGTRVMRFGTYTKVLDSLEGREGVPLNTYATLGTLSRAAGYSYDGWPEVVEKFLNDPSLDSVLDKVRACTIPEGVLPLVSEFLEVAREYNLFGEKKPEPEPEEPEQPSEPGKGSSGEKNEDQEESEGESTDEEQSEDSEENPSSGDQESEDEPGSSSEPTQDSESEDSDSSEPDEETEEDSEESDEEGSGSSSDSEEESEQDSSSGGGSESDSAGGFEDFDEEDSSDSSGEEEGPESDSNDGQSDEDSESNDDESGDEAVTNSEASESSEGRDTHSEDEGVSESNVGSPGGISGDLGDSDDSGSDDPDETDGNEIPEGSAEEAEDILAEAMGHSDFSNENSYVTPEDMKQIASAVYAFDENAKSVNAIAELKFDHSAKKWAAYENGKYVGFQNQVCNEIAIAQKNLKEQEEYLRRYYPSQLFESWDSRGILESALSKMRIIFSENDKSKTHANLRSGKVNTRALGKRAPIGDDRLFKRKTFPKKRDYAVLIVVDISGSTASGNTLNLEINAVKAQAELLSRLGVKFSIVAHSGMYLMPFEEYHSKHKGRGRKRITDGPGSTLTWVKLVVKDWDEPWAAKTREAADNLAYYAYNLDGHTMAFARKEILRRKESERIIMYYSDGQMPAENFAEELGLLKDELKVLKNAGVVVAGVGINSDAPSKHGLPTVVVQKETDLPSVVNHLEKLMV